MMRKTDVEISYGQQTYGVEVSVGIYISELISAHNLH